MTDEGSAPTTDIRELVDELRARVEQRQREGFYPVELGLELHEHFRRITSHRTVPDLDIMRRQLEGLDVVSYFSPARISEDSSVVGGRVLHSLVAKAVGRQTQGILEQVQQFADAVRQVLTTVLAALEEPHAHVHADLVGQIDALYERVASFERGPVGPQAAIAALRVRVKALEALEASRRFSPYFDNARFEEHFRGTREDLVQRYRSLAQEFEAFGPVLDIGCGRGEFLEVLHDAGIEAAGVEIDGVLVEECRRRGFTVEAADGIAYLSSLPDESLGGIVLIQVIEHLSRQQAADLVLLAREKLRPGGRIVIETVNPQSLYVFAHAFYLDPTHTFPVHPLYLRFLFEEAGFAHIRIEWRSDPPLDESLDPLSGDDELTKAMNQNIERINRLLFAPQDYALIATR